MTLLLLEASPWMSFSFERERFQFGILLLLEGRMFNRAFNFFSLTLYCFTIAWIIFLSSFAPLDDWKLALLLLEQQYTKARSNRAKDVSSLDCLWILFRLCIIYCSLTWISLALHLGSLLLSQQLQKRFLDEVWCIQLALCLWV